MRAAARVLILLTMAVAGHCREWPSCDSVYPQWGRENCVSANSTHSKCLCVEEYTRPIPLYGEITRTRLIHLGPKRLGFIPQNVTITSRARSRVSFNFSFAEDTVFRRDEFYNGSVEWNGLRCDIPACGNSFRRGNNNFMFKMTEYYGYAGKGYERCVTMGPRISCQQFNPSRGIGIEFNSGGR